MATARPQHQQQQHGARRILRIGVILGGKIVEERLIRDTSKDVTIGQSARNTFSVPLEGLPRTWPLFAAQGDRYVLNFTEAMDGRISDASGAIYTLDQLKSGGAQRQADRWTVPVAPTARGKVVLGDMTLLFQFVAEPPLQPKPHLPASVRGTLADRIDPYLAVVLVISLLFHTSATVYFGWIRDRVVDQSRASKVYKRTFDRPVAVSRDIFEQPVVPTEGEEPTEEPAEEPGEPEEEPQDEPPKGGGEDKGPTEAERAAAREEARLRAEEDARAAIAAVTGKNKSDSGMASAGPDDINVVEGEVEAIGDKIKGGEKIAVGGKKGNEIKGGGPGGPGGAADEDRKGPGDIAGGGGGKPKKGKVTLGPAGGDKKTGSWDPTDVTNKIKRVYMSQLQRCHERALAGDPTAGGRVELSFQITETGRATGPSANGFSSTVDTCIEGVMRTWSFPPPKDEDGDPFEAYYSLTLSMQAP